MITSWVLSFPWTAFAQAIDPVVPEAVAARLREGVALRAQGRDQEALAVFEEALSGAPDLGRAHAQVGLAQFALGRWLEAESHLRTALTSNDPWVERNRASLETSSAEVESHLGTLEVEVHPPDALVSLDSQPFERQTRFRVVAGQHTVHAHLAAGGSTPRSAEIDVLPQTVTRVVLELEPPPPSRQEPVPEPAPSAPSPHPLVWIGAITSVAAAAALVPTYILGLDRERTLSSQYNAQCVDSAGCPELHRSLVSQLDPYAWATNALWGVLAAGGILTTTGIILTFSEEHGSDGALSGASLHLRGAW